jgi:hypothetical protein
LPVTGKFVAGERKKRAAILPGVLGAIRFATGKFVVGEREKRAAILPGVLGSDRVCYQEVKGWAMCRRISFAFPYYKYFRNGLDFRKSFYKIDRLNSRWSGIFNKPRPFCLTK